MERYKERFNIANQDFLAQKHSQKLIVAKRYENFLIEGSPIIQSFGLKNLYYAPLSFNCLYDCEYCYLQGLYPSANIVVFANLDDYKHAIEEKLEKDSLYVCLSYDCDILAIESIFGIAAEFVEFAKDKTNLTIEIRTKSANFNAIKHLSPNHQTILAWSIAPDSFIKQYESKTPSLNARLKAIKEAQERGWRTRICLEPILAAGNWQQEYIKMIDELFNTIEADKIDSINIDPFRMSKIVLKRIQKLREESYILNEDLFEYGEIISYKSEILTQINDIISAKLMQFIPKNKIFIQ